jgi:hypothetical protein
MLLRLVAHEARNSGKEKLVPVAPSIPLSEGPVKGLTYGPNMIFMENSLQVDPMCSCRKF